MTLNPAFLWVALVFFTSIAIGRRLGLQLPWRTATFFYLLTLVFLWRPLTGSFVGVPADYLRVLEPWRSLVTEGQNRNGEINDVILQMVPWAHQVRESWLRLEAPLWNAAAGGGYPLLANGQSAGLSPFRLINLPLPLGPALAAESALKLLIAASFMFLLLRLRSVSETGATAGAVGFAFSTFLIVWLGFPHSTVAALLPMVIFGIDRIAGVVTPRRFVFLSIAFALLLVGGHPESAAHVVLAAGAWVLMLIALRETSLKSVAAITASGVTGLLLAAPAVLPLVEMIPRSQRMDWLRADLHADAPWSPALLIQMFLQPGFFGTLREGNLWGPGQAEFISGYAGIAATVGVLATAIHLVRSRSADWRIFPVVMTPLIALIVIGTPFLRDAFDALPLFSMAANGRLRLALCFSGAIAIALLIDILRIDRRSALIASVAVLLALPAIYIAHDIPPRHIGGLLVDLSPRVAAVLAVAAAGLAILRGRARAIVLLSLVAIDLWWFGLAWNPIVPATELYPPTPLMESVVRVVRSEGEPVRVAGLGGFMFPNSAAMYDIEDIRAHDPMAYGRTLRLLRVFAGYSTEQYFGMLERARDPILDFLNVRYVVTSNSHRFDTRRLTPVYRGREGVVWRNDSAAARFFAPRSVRLIEDPDRAIDALTRYGGWVTAPVIESLPGSSAATAGAQPGARLRVVDYSPRRTVLEVVAPAETIVASSVPHGIGWRVSAGGRQLPPVRINTAFLGFVAPAGRSSIVLAYEPASWRLGLALSAVASTGVLILFLAGARKRRETL